MSQATESLDSLKALVEARHHEIEILRSRLAAMKAFQAAKTIPPAAVLTAPATRRRMLGRLAGVLLGLGGVSLGWQASARPAQAKLTITQDPFVGQVILPKGKTISIAPGSNPTAEKVALITGAENQNITEFPYDDSAIFTKGTNTRGAHGRSNSGIGVFNDSFQGGLSALSYSAAALHGKAVSGVGVRAKSLNNNGLYIQSDLGVPLHIKPSESEPAGNHNIGEMYVNTKGELFIWAHSGFLSDWRKVEFV